VQVAPASVGGAPLPPEFKKPYIDVCQTRFEAGFNAGYAQARARWRHAWIRHLHHRHRHHHRHHRRHHVHHEHVIVVHDQEPDKEEASEESSESSEGSTRFRVGGKMSGEGSEGADTYPGFINDTRKARVFAALLIFVFAMVVFFLAFKSKPRRTVTQETV